MLTEKEKQILFDLLEEEIEVHKVELEMYTGVEIQASAKEAIKDIKTIEEKLDLIKL